MLRPTSIDCHDHSVGGPSACQLFVQQYGQNDCEGKLVTIAIDGFTFELISALSLNISLTNGLFADAIFFDAAFPRSLALAFKTNQLYTFIDNSPVASSAYGQLSYLVTFGFSTCDSIITWTDYAASFTIQVVESNLGDRPDTIYHQFENTEENLAFPIKITEEYNETQTSTNYPSIPTTLINSYNYPEPWFECEVDNRHDTTIGGNNLGFADLLQYSYTIGDGELQIIGMAVTLKGKYVDACLDEASTIVYENSYGTDLIDGLSDEVNEYSNNNECSKCAADVELDDCLLAIIAREMRNTQIINSDVSSGLTLSMPAVDDSRLAGIALIIRNKRQKFGSIQASTKITFVAYEQSDLYANRNCDDATTPRMFGYYLDAPDVSDGDGYITTSISVDDYVDIIITAGATTRKTGIGQMKNSIGEDISDSDADANFQEQAAFLHIFPMSSGTYADAKFYLLTGEGQSSAIFYLATLELDFHDEQTDITDYDTDFQHGTDTHLVFFTKYSDAHTNDPLEDSNYAIFHYKIRKNTTGGTLTFDLMFQQATSKKIIFTGDTNTSLKSANNLGYDASLSFRCYQVRGPVVAFFTQEGVLIYNPYTQFQHLLKVQDFGMDVNFAYWGGNNDNGSNPILYIGGSYTVASLSQPIIVVISELFENNFDGSGSYIGIEQQGGSYTLMSEQSKGNEYIFGATTQNTGAGIYGIDFWNSLGSEIGSYTLSYIDLLTPTQAIAISCFVSENDINSGCLLLNRHSNTEMSLTKIELHPDRLEITSFTYGSAYPSTPKVVAYGFGTESPTNIAYAFSGHNYHSRSSVTVVGTSRTTDCEHVLNWRTKSLVEDVSVSVKEIIVTGGCQSTNNGAVDSFGQGCDWHGYPSQCGDWDDDDFIATEMCCSCSGGEEVPTIFGQILSLISSNSVITTQSLSQTEISELDVYSIDLQGGIGSPEADGIPYEWFSCEFIHARQDEISVSGLTNLENGKYEYIIGRNTETKIIEVPNASLTSHWGAVVGSCIDRVKGLKTVITLDDKTDLGTNGNLDYFDFSDHISCSNYDLTDKLQECYAADFVYNIQHTNGSTSTNLSLPNAAAILNGVRILITIKQYSTFQIIANNLFDIQFNVEVPATANFSTYQGLNTCTIDAVMPRVYGSKFTEEAQLIQSTSYSSVDVSVAMDVIVTGGYTGYDPSTDGSGKVFNENNEEVSFTDSNPNPNSLFYNVTLIHVYPMAGGTYGKAKYFMNDYGTSTRLYSLVILSVEDDAASLFKSNVDPSYVYGSHSHIVSYVQLGYDSVHIVHQRLVKSGQGSYLDFHLEHVNSYEIIQDDFDPSYDSYIMPKSPQNTLAVQYSESLDVVLVAFILPDYVRSKEIPQQVVIFSLMSDTNDVNHSVHRIPGTRYSMWPSFIQWTEDRYYKEQGANLPSLIISSTYYRLDAPYKTVGGIYQFVLGTANAFVRERKLEIDNIWDIQVGNDGSYVLLTRKMATTQEDSDIWIAAMRVQDVARNDLRQEIHMQTISGDKYEVKTYSIVSGKFPEVVTFGSWIDNSCRIILAQDSQRMYITDLLAFTTGGEVTLSLSTDVTEILYKSSSDYVNIVNSAHIFSKDDQQYLTYVFTTNYYSSGGGADVLNDYYHAYVTLLSDNAQNDDELCQTQPFAQEEGNIVLIQHAAYQSVIDNDFGIFPEPQDTDPSTISQTMLNLDVSQLLIAEFRGSYGTRFTEEWFACSFTDVGTSLQDVVDYEIGSEQVFTAERSVQLDPVTCVDNEIDATLQFLYYIDEDGPSVDFYIDFPEFRQSYFDNNNQPTCDNQFYDEITPFIFCLGTQLVASFEIVPTQYSYGMSFKVQEVTDHRLDGVEIHVKYKYQTTNLAGETDVFTIKFMSLTPEPPIPRPELDLELDLLDPQYSPFLNSPPQSSTIYRVDIGEEKIIVLGQPSSIFPDDEIEIKVYHSNVQLGGCPTSDCPVVFESERGTITLVSSEEVFEKNTYIVIRSILDENDDRIEYLELINMRVDIRLNSLITLQETQYSFNVVLSHVYSVDKPAPQVIPDESTSNDDVTQDDTNSDTTGTESDNTGTESNTDAATDNQTEEETERNAGDTGSTSETDDSRGRNSEVVDVDNLPDEIVEEANELAKKLDNITGSDALQEAIDSVLERLPNDIDTNEQQSAVAEVGDYTNFDEAKDFDFISWCRTKGISYGNNNEIGSEDSVTYVLQSIEDFYSVPFKQDIDRDGKVSIGFSSPLKQISFRNIFLRLNYSGTLSENSLRSLEQDQVNSEVLEQPEENDNVIIDEMKKLEELLKETKSIMLELVAGNAINADEKGYNWSLIQFTEDRLDLKINFNNPSVISYDQADTLKIKFQNTPLYLIPSNDDLSPIPDGYKLTISLPVQNPPDNKNEAKLIEAQLTGLLIFNLIMAFVLKFSYQELLGMINSLQIVAHLPLNNIPLPSNVYQTFDILVKCVSFDFFPVHEYVDMKFTVTEPWSDRFEWLDYGSVNFIESMGSATIVYTILFLYQLVTTIVCGIEKYKGKLFHFRGKTKKGLEHHLYSMDVSQESKRDLKESADVFKTKQEVQQLEGGEVIVQPSDDSQDENDQNLIRRQSSMVKIVKAVKRTPKCYELFIQNSKQRMYERLNEALDPITCIQVTLTILIETFLELLICSSISMRMFSIRDFWNFSDKISVGLSFVALIVLFLFVLLGLKFTFFDARNLSIVNKAKRNKIYGDVLDVARADHVEMAKETAKKAKEAAPDLQRQTTIQVDFGLKRMLSKAIKRDSNIEFQASKIIESDYEVYRPFFTAPGASNNESLKTYSFRAMMFINSLLIRRIILLYIAMFLSSQAWIQVSIFVWMTLLNIFYLGYVMPHIQRGQNVMEIVNEFFILICGYLAMTLVGISQNPTMSDEIGKIMANVLKTVVFINVISILFSIFKQLKLRIRKFNNQLKKKVAKTKRRQRIKSALSKKMKLDIIKLTGASMKTDGQSNPVKVDKSSWAHQTSSESSVWEQLQVNQSGSQSNSNLLISAANEICDDSRLIQMNDYQSKEIIEDLNVFEADQEGQFEFLKIPSVVTSRNLVQSNKPKHLFQSIGKHTTAQHSFQNAFDFGDEFLQPEQTHRISDDDNSFLEDNHNAETPNESITVRDNKARGSAQLMMTTEEDQEDQRQLSLPKFTDSTPSQTPDITEDQPATENDVINTNQLASDIESNPFYRDHSKQKRETIHSKVVVEALDDKVNMMIVSEEDNREQFDPQQLMAELQMVKNNTTKIEQEEEKVKSRDTLDPKEFLWKRTRGDQGQHRDSEFQQDAKQFNSYLDELLEKSRQGSDCSKVSFSRSQRDNKPKQSTYAVQKISRDSHMAKKQEIEEIVLVSEQQKRKTPYMAEDDIVDNDGIMFSSSSSNNDDAKNQEEFDNVTSQMTIQMKTLSSFNFKEYIQAKEQKTNKQKTLLSSVKSKSSSKKEEASKAAVHQMLIGLHETVIVDDSKDAKTDQKDDVIVTTNNSNVSQDLYLEEIDDNFYNDIND